MWQVHDLHLYSEHVILLLLQCWLLLAAHPHVRLCCAVDVTVECQKMNRQCLYDTVEREFFLSEYLLSFREMNIHLKYFPFLEV